MNPFKEDGNWYRGNIHSHTTNSDGWLSPENLVKAYSVSGYHFLSITDHWKLTVINSQLPKDFILIPGIELHGGRTEVGDLHFLGIDINKPIENKKGNLDLYSPQELVDLILEANGVPILAHPSWNGVTFADIISIKGLIGIEVYNTGCDKEIARGFGEIQWDDLIARREKFYGFAVDDCHRISYDTFGGWIWVKAKELSYSSIISSIKNGNFYSSMGPIIKDIEVHKDYVQISSSPVRRINLIGNPRYGCSVFSRENEYLTETKVPLRSEITYFRIEIVDSSGRKAWSNPFYIMRKD